MASYDSTNKVLCSFYEMEIYWAESIIRKSLECCIFFFTSNLFLIRTLPWVCLNALLAKMDFCRLCKYSGWPAYETYKYIELFYVAAILQKLGQEVGGRRYCFSLSVQGFSLRILKCWSTSIYLLILVPNVSQVCTLQGHLFFLFLCQH